MIFGSDAGAVDLDDAIAETEVGGDGRRVGVDVADELAGPAALGVQVEAVAVEVRPLPQVAQARPRSIVRRHAGPTDDLCGRLRFLCTDNSHSRYVLGGRGSDVYNITT